MVATAILESKNSCSQVRVNHRTDKHNWIKEITVIITKAGMDPNTPKVQKNWLAMFIKA